MMSMNLFFHFPVTFPFNKESGDFNFEKNPEKISVKIDK